MAKRAFNIPNMLTYARIVAVPLVVLCFFLEGKLQSSDFARWTALTLFIVASLTDYLDGYLARLWKQSSTIGRMLDPIADKLLVSACLLLLAAAQGCLITISASGADEEQALAALCALVSRGFDEAAPCA